MAPFVEEIGATFKIPGYQPMCSTSFSQMICTPHHRTDLSLCRAGDGHKICNMGPGE